MSKQQVLIDAEGYEVPVKYIDPVVLKRHDLVEDVFTDIEKLQEQIAKVKLAVTHKIKQYLELTAEDHGEKWQGNATLRNFDASKECEIKIAKRLELDERLQIAKSKIDDCIKKWSKGSGDKIKALVNRAFKVDSKGQVDTRQILGLRNLKFDDPEWNEAMDLISDSVTISSIKEFFYFKKKNDQGAYITIPLNFHSV